MIPIQVPMTVANDDVEFSMSASSNNVQLGMDAGMGIVAIADYERLNHKPQINGVELVGNKTASDLGLATPADIPTKTSELENDSGYITDAGVTSFNGQTGDVTYSAPVSSVNGQTGDVTISVPVVPTDVSAFNNDAGYITSAQAPVQSVNGQTGAVSLTIPTVPTDVSAFNNDAGYITGINSSDVTNALGYTPYSDANPSGYVDSAGAANAAPVQSVNGQTGAVSIAIPAVPSPSSANPANLGTASPGASADYARADHVHAKPTASDVGAIAAPGAPNTGDILTYSGAYWYAATPDASLVGAIPMPNSLNNGQVLTLQNGVWSGDDLYAMLQNENASLVPITTDGTYYYIDMDMQSLLNLFASCRKAFFFEYDSGTGDTLFYDVRSYNATTYEVILTTLSTYNRLNLTFHPNHNDGYATMIGTAEMIPSGEGKIDAPSSPSVGDFLVYTNNGWDAVTMAEWQGGNY